MPIAGRTRNGRVVRKQKGPAQSSNAKRRRVEPEVSLSLSESDTEMPDVDEILFDTMKQACSSTFTVWSVTPLKNLEHTQTRLSGAARNIALNLKHKFGVAFTVSVKTVEGIAAKDNDGRAIMIDVQESIQTDREGYGRSLRKPQSCKCILGCRNNQQNRKTGTPLTNGYLPVLIAFGPLPLVKKVTTALRICFDCYCQQLTFQGAGISTVFSYWIVKEMKDPEQKSIKITLRTPIKGDSVDAHFPLSKLRKTMAGRRKIYSSRLWLMILEKLHRDCVLDFDPRARIDEVSTRFIRVYLNGRIKVHLQTLEDVQMLWWTLTTISEGINEISIPLNS